MQFCRFQPTTPTFVAALVLFAALFAAARSFAGGPTEALVMSETGFDGAVTVVREETTDGIVCVTVNVPYLDIRGDSKLGQAQLFVQRDLVTPGKQLPVICATHYEAKAGPSREACKNGFVFVTPHYGEAATGEFPAGDSYNLARAIIQWTRRLPFIDRLHLQTTGASAGGYMSLAMSAECFPVAATFAGAPLFNWAYNMNYIHTNAPLVRRELPNCGESPMPILCIVLRIPDDAFALFGSDLASDVWYHISPLSYLDRITCPVLITTSTADVLTPMQQLLRQPEHPYDPAQFPEGYTWDFDALTLVPQAKKTLEESLPADQLSVEVLAAPEGAQELTFDHTVGKAPMPMPPAPFDWPWSPRRQWSVVVMDEGPPTPGSNHQRYIWGGGPTAFTTAFKSNPPPVSLLNAAKLERLLERYQGMEDARVTLEDGTVVQRLNFETLEKWDVVTGLLDYAALGKEYKARLQALYKKSTMQPFGKRIALKRLSSAQSELQKALGR